MHNGVSQQTTLQMSHSPNKSQYYDVSRNGNRYGDHRWVFYIIPIIAIVDFFLTLYDKLTAIKTVTAIINSSSSSSRRSSNKARTRIDHIHCPEQWYSHTIKWPAIIRKIDEIAAAIIPMVAAITIIIIVKRWNARMAQTRRTFISCHRRGSTVGRWWGCLSTTTKIPNEREIRWWWWNERKRERELRHNCDLGIVKLIRHFLGVIGRFSMCTFSHYE